MLLDLIKGSKATSQGAGGGGKRSKRVERQNKTTIKVRGEFPLLGRTMSGVSNSNPIIYTDDCISFIFISRHVITGGAGRRENWKLSSSSLVSPGEAVHISVKSIDFSKF
jgi:hypothetical protein